MRLYEPVYLSWSIIHTNPRLAVSRLLKEVTMRFLSKLIGALLAVYLSSLPAFADQPYELRSDGLRAGMSTFTVTGIGYTAYATPTDMIGICGSDTRTVVVTNMYMRISTTSAALQTVYWLKRSTPDTGGTFTNPTPMHNDVQDAATGIQTATPFVYTAAPTTGTLVGNFEIDQTTSTVLTGTGGISGLFDIPSPFNTMSNTLTSYQRPIILRSSQSCIYANYNGAALTSGFTSIYYIQWTEY